MSEQPLDYETQIKAMRSIMEVLTPLSPESRHAVLAWVDTQIGRKALGAQSSRAEPPSQQTMKREGTINAVAQKLGATSCRQLFEAAAAYLSIYQGQESFTRDELIASAKEARAWKVDYSNRMAMSITRMMDAGFLFEKARDVFAISDATLKELEAKLSA